MRMTSKGSDRHSSQRRGFTLIELLVVIAIIAVLVALTAAAAISVLGTTAQKTTIATMEKIQTSLKQHWSAVVENAKIRSVPAGVTRWAGGDAHRAKIIWQKLQLRRAFPQTYEEVYFPAGRNNPYVSNTDLPPIQSYVAAVTKARQTKPNPSREVQSATLLLLALQQSRRGGQRLDAAAVLGTEALKDTNGDGLQEIVDGWGNPLVLYRWGVGNPKLDMISSAPDTISRDTEDPEHLLMNRNWNRAGSTEVAWFQNVLHPIQTGTGSSAVPRSWYTEPTLVSYGEDGKSGLGAFMSVTGGDAADNLFSFEYR